MHGEGLPKCVRARNEFTCMNGRPRLEHTGEHAHNRLRCTGYNPVTCVTEFRRKRQAARNVQYHQDQTICNKRNIGVIGRDINTKNRENVRNLWLSQACKREKWIVKDAYGNRMKSDRDTGKNKGGRRKDHAKDRAHKKHEHHT